MFSQVFVCPQSASWLLVHSSSLLRRGCFVISLHIRGMWETTVMQNFLEFFEIWFKMPLVSCDHGYHLVIYVLNVAWIALLVIWILTGDNSIVFEDLWFVETPYLWVGVWVAQGWLDGWMGRSCEITSNWINNLDLLEIISIWFMICKDISIHITAKCGHSFDIWLLT